MKAWERGYPHNICETEYLKFDELPEFSHHYLDEERIADQIGFSHSELTLLERGLLDSSEIHDLSSEILLNDTYIQQVDDGLLDSATEHSLLFLDKQRDGQDLNKVVGDILKNQGKRKRSMVKRKLMKKKWSKHKRSESIPPNHQSTDSESIDNGSMKKLGHKPKRSIALARKLKRWGKAEDKLMFDLLKTNSIREGINIEDLVMPESLRPESNHYQLLLNLKREMNWVGTTRQILQRIWILKENTKLSVRDERLVRKIANEQVAAKSLNFEAILYNFPCKDEDEIKSICNKIFQKQMQASV
jgi:hypothetical protein